MAFLIVLAALCFLMFVAYRGYSVILFAPVAALGAVLLTDPQLVAPMFTGLFMDKMVGFLKLYFPVFLLGAIFGKVIEVSGFSKAIVAATIRVVGAQRAMLAIVAVCALLTYGGVSLFVVVFAVYPFAAELFRQSDIPKRLIPGTIALGAFTFTMDALPGTPQIQNIIPTTFFGTNTWAAPVLGTLGGVFILIIGLLYLDWRRRAALKAGEGYGDPATLINEPLAFAGGKLANPLIAIAPLLVVGIANKLLTLSIPDLYGESHSFDPAVIGNAAPVVQEVSKVAAIWAVEGALLAGIACVLLFAWKPVTASFAEGSKSAIGGALLAGMNTASEYGFGAVIAALPGFLVVANALGSIPNPLVNEAVTVTALAGITGSASGGMSIALAAMAETFIANANAAGIPMEVLHRVAAMASGGMDTLPHNGAVITLLAVTGLTHRQAYKDIFAITCIKTMAVFAMLQLPSLLDDWLLALEPRIGGDWRMVLNLSYIYAKSAVVVLAATFVLHLLLRALWIALVGLHSVYPQGVRLDKLKMGPIQSEIARAHRYDMPSAIERADNRASVAFAIGVMVATLLVAICVLFPGFLLLLNIVGILIGIRIDPVVVFACVGVALLVPITSALLIDQSIGSRLRPEGLPYRITHWVLRMVARLGLGSNSTLMMSVLSSNDGQRRMLVMQFAIMMLALGSVGASLASITKPELFGSYTLFPNSKSSRIDPSHYDDQRDPARAGNSPYVQAMVVTDPYLQLTVPYNPRRVEPAMRSCKAPGKQARDARSAALLACLQSLHGVTLDGAALPGLQFEIASDPRTNRPALLAMIDIRDLPDGRHELRVSRPPVADKQPDKDDPDPGYDAIPFWR